jgi:hypothetical protein
MGNKSAKEILFQPPPRNAASIYCIVEPYRIHYLCCLLEAYEGLAISTTLDPRLGLLRLSVAPGCEADLLKLLESEKETLKLRAVSTTPPLDPAVDETAVRRQPSRDSF